MTKEIMKCKKCGHPIRNSLNTVAPHQHRRWRGQPISWSGECGVRIETIIDGKKTFYKCGCERAEPNQIRVKSLERVKSLRETAKTFRQLQGFFKDSTEKDLKGLSEICEGLSEICDNLAIAIHVNQEAGSGLQQTPDSTTASREVQNSPPTAQEVSP